MSKAIKIRYKLREIGLFFARPHVLFYALPWLMFLTVMGTISQKNLGLHDATERYFSNFILWLGPIPTPGGALTISFIFISLCVKFIFFSQWNKKKFGSHIIHFGILLLLLGGIITALTQKEGVMILPEGQSLSAYDDYYKRVLTITKNNKTIETIPFDTLIKNHNFKIQGVEFKVLQACNNCGARAPSGIFENPQGLAVNMELYTLPSEKEKEVNFSGLTLDIINGTNPNQSGTYILMEDIPKNPVFNDSLTLSLTRKKTPLPFEIKLLDFRKIDYPGTTKAREFESDLMIKDNDLNWPVTISMNKPLRYKGYIFFQSSFEQRPDIEVTVLNVVQNKGRLFPYISTLIIFLGMVVHIIIHLQSKYKKRSK